LSYDYKSKEYKDYKAKKKAEKKAKKESRKEIWKHGTRKEKVRDFFFG
jgi:hypothetical protein